MRYLNKNRLTAILLGLLILISGSACWKNQPSIPDKPKDIAWGLRGEKGYSQEVIDNYNWMCVNQDNYECKQK